MLAGQAAQVGYVFNPTGKPALTKVVYGTGELRDTKKPLWSQNFSLDVRPVSYTHLDVYKRQMLDSLANHFNLFESELKELAKTFNGNQYGEYLLSLAEGKIQ